jgi:folate-binding protein YgfZ
MTDVNVAASPTATVLAGYLDEKKPQPDMAPYRGVLTPIELDARPQEIEALRSGCALHDQGWQRRVAVRGRDRFRWLSGMVTNMVKELSPDAGAWNLVLNAQGRIQGDLTVWRDADDLELEIEAAQYDKILAHLNHFIIMDDVDLVPLQGEAIGVTGPKASQVLRDLGLPVLNDSLTQTRAEWNGVQLLIRREYGVLADHYTLWIDADHTPALWEALVSAAAKPAGSAALEAFRIAEGIPVYGTDIADRDLPQETSQLRTLHFNKGCYLGQEIVERIRSRGNVHRHLRSLELDGRVPPSGTKLTLDNTEVGHITSASELPLSGGTRVFALGMIRAEADGRNLPLSYQAGELTGSARILASPPTL